MNKIKLDNVTLVALGSTKIKENIDALQYSAQNIDFAAVKFISHERPGNLPPKIKFEKYKGFKGSIDFKEYSYYCIYNLVNHIETDFVLLVQPDGFIINPHKWEDSFLEWDYIGAVWPIRADAYIDPYGNHIRVGNGGFTLRSKKLLEVPQIEEIPFEVNQGTFYKHMNAGAYNEDGNICVHNRHLFEKHGVKFAPVEVAVRFSQELPVSEAAGVMPFGFHRYLPEGSVIKRRKSEDY